MAFLTEPPLEILRRSNVSIPWLTGVNSHEGLISLAALVTNQSLQDHLADPKNWPKSMPILMFMPDAKEKHLREIHKYYFGMEDPIFRLNHAENCTDLFSDVYSNYGFMEAVKLHAQHAPVHAYQFSRSGPFSLYNFLVSLKGEYPIFIEVMMYRITKWIAQHLIGTSQQGCCHADELAYLFKLDGVHEVTAQDPEFEMSKALVKIWTDFAKNESSLKFKLLNWTPFDPNLPHFKVFNIDDKPGYGFITPSFVDRINFLKTNIFSAQV